MSRARDRCLARAGRDDARAGRGRARGSPTRPRLARWRVADARATRGDEISRMEKTVTPPERARAEGAERGVIAAWSAHPRTSASVPEALTFPGRGWFGDGRYRCPCAHARRARARRARAAEDADATGAEGDAEGDAGVASCASHAMALARRGFAMAYATRAGISLAAHVARTARGRGARKVFDLTHLVGESSLRYREDAVRFGLFAATFAGGYSATRCWLCYATAPAANRAAGAAKATKAVASWSAEAHVPAVARFAREPFTPESAASIAGGVSALAVFFLKPKYRRAFSLFLVAKLAQAGYASAGKVHPWLKEGPGQWKHTTFSLFALSSAQIMYAYVMRPDTLDPGFWNFIVQAGPIDKATLATVRESVQRGASGAVVGCDHTHKSTGAIWCSSHVVSSSLSTFRKCFPFYFSIHYVPYVVLNLTKAISKPVHTLYRATKATVRSSAMLSTYVGLYMSTVCLHRKSGAPDHRALYYLAGIVASGALFVETESRRADLMLWVVPRAVDSLVLVMLHKRMLPRVPNFEAYLFALAMSGVMNFYESEPDVLDGTMTRFIARFVEPQVGDGEVLPKKNQYSRTASVSFM